MRRFRMSRFYKNAPRDYNIPREIRMNLIIQFEPVADDDSLGSDDVSPLSKQPIVLNLGNIVL